MSATPDDAHNSHKQLMLAFENGVVEPGARLDVSFLHKSFCLAGLPLRRPKDPFKPFSRNDERFALTINPWEQRLPGGLDLHVGVPWGAKARLMMVWAATEAKNPNRSANDRWLEIGRISDWLQSIGIGKTGPDMLAAKDQLVRLSFSLISMVLKTGTGEHLFTRDSMIESAIFPDGDLEHYAQGDLKRMRWPSGVQLTEKAHTRFREHAIPIPTQRLVKIAHNPMAIDIFLFLCYRLPTLSPDEKLLVAWRDLIAQFGNNEPPSKFRDTFTNSIKAALNAYPEANVDLTDEGLLLEYSDPAELRKAFVAVSKPALTIEAKRVRKRFNPKKSEESKEISMSL